LIGGGVDFLRRTREAAGGGRWRRALRRCFCRAVLWRNEPLFMVRRLARERKE
jgi:hypothetical protein